MAGTRLRIAGGTARGIPVAEPRGVRLRPTSGLVREAIFNILGDRVTGARVLDLYAGTGALGVEALSRGAAHATFIEAQQACCQAILKTLSRAGVASAGTVMRGRLPKALEGQEGPFDLILMDPPYDDEDAPETLSMLASKLAEDGWIVYEHGSRYNPPERPAGLTMAERRVYGDTAVAFYRREEAA